MNTFIVTQKILSFGATYIVTKSDSDDTIITVKGKLLTLSPKLDAFRGNSETKIANMTGNFLKTNFDINDAFGNNITSIKFEFLI